MARMRLYKCGNLPNVNPYYWICPSGDPDLDRYAKEPGFKLIPVVFDSGAVAVAYADQHGMPFPPSTQSYYDSIRARR